MIIVVMGAAGFGANLVKVLNERGETDILAVDNIACSEKFRNLPDSVWSGPDHATKP